MAAGAGAGGGGGEGDSNGGGTSPGGVSAAAPAIGPHHLGVAAAEGGGGVICSVLLVRGSRDGAAMSRAVGVCGRSWGPRGRWLVRVPRWSLGGGDDSMGTPGNSVCDRLSGLWLITLLGGGIGVEQGRVRVSMRGGGCGIAKAIPAPPARSSRAHRGLISDRSW